jgi:hypothetical protein
MALQLKKLGKGKNYVATILLVGHHCVREDDVCMVQCYVYECYVVGCVET